MGAYLSNPNTEKKSTDESSKYFNVAVSSMQGWRMEQEDDHTSILQFDPALCSSIFSVYDGHGGPEVSNYCANFFPAFLKSYIEETMAKTGKTLCDASVETVSQILKDAFIAFDHHLTEDNVKEKLKAIAKELQRNNATSSTAEEDGDNSSLEDEENPHALLEDAVTPLDEVLDKQLPASDRQKAVKSQRIFFNRMRRLFMEAEEGDPTTTKEMSSSSSSANPEDAESGVAVEIPVRHVEATNSEGGPSSSSGIQTSNSSDPETEDLNDDDFVMETVDEDNDEDDETSSEDEKDLQTSKSEWSKALKKEWKKMASSLDSGPQTRRQKKIKSAEKSGDEDSDEKELCEEEEDDSEEEECDEEQDEEEEEDDDDDEGEEEEDETCKGAKSLWATVMSAARGASELDHNIPGEDSGTTAVMAMLLPQWKSVAQNGSVMGNGDKSVSTEKGGDESEAVLRLYVANVGDSRCVLCRNGQAVDMSLDHKPDDDEELQRITAAGGTVTPEGRVNGGLNLSRALGDHAYKKNTDLSLKEQMICALPDVMVQELRPGEDEFLVLACDGIWNSLNSQQVVDFVRERLPAGKKNGAGGGANGSNQDAAENGFAEENLSKIIEEMFDKCLSPDTSGDGTGCDNMTAIIVLFKDLEGFLANYKLKHSPLNNDMKEAQHGGDEVATEEVKSPSAKRARLAESNRETGEVDV